MKKVLVMMCVVASVVMMGCGDSASTDVTAGGKNSLNPEPPKANAQTGKQAGVADDKAYPAPAGVKTGTPGG